MQKTHPADTLVNFERLEPEYHLNTVTGELITNDEHAKMAIDLIDQPEDAPTQAYA